MKENNLSTVYVIQEIPGTKEGKPKINILGAAQYGTFKFLIPELFTDHFFTRSSYF